MFNFYKKNAHSRGTALPIWDIRYETGLIKNLNKFSHFSTRSCWHSAGSTCACALASKQVNASHRLPPGPGADQARGQAAA